MSHDEHPPPSYGGYFPGDPRVLGYLLTPTEADVNALKCDEWLSTHLRDSMIQRAGISPDINADPFAPLLGSLGADVYISSMNLTASLKRAQVKKVKEWKNNQESIKKLRQVKICDATANFNQREIISPHCTLVESAS